MKQAILRHASGKDGEFADINAYDYLDLLRRQGYSDRYVKLLIDEVEAQATTFLG